MIKGWPIPRLYEGMTIADITEFLFLEDEPAVAELIFVFGGRNEARALRAADLYRRGLAPRVLIAGGYNRELGQTEAEFLGRLALEQGVAREDLILEMRSANTEENVAMGRELLEKLGLLPQDTVLLVSAPLHMRRARLIFEHYFPGVRALCCPDGRPEVRRDNWWQSEEGRRLVFRELEKVRTLQQRGEM
ncbi:MAG: YdcF family protein [Bacillota bacterium]